MELIVPHINADFDAVASAVAASKLYPQAKLFFPGSQERNVRQFLTAHPTVLPEVIKAKKLQKKLIRTIILVDVSHPDRLGQYQDLLELKSVKVIRFDHHQTPTSLPNFFQQQQAGANTSLMIKLLQAKRLKLDRASATLLGLGIYEETGHFSYSTTTAWDYQAMAWCKQQGADIEEIINCLKQPFDQEQQALFDDLIKSRKTKTINGIPISWALAKRDHFIEDLALLASRLKEIENLPVLFVFCQMGTRIYLVARSSSEALPADRVVAWFGGGGGHATAASTVIKHQRLSSLKDQLLSCLQQLVKPAQTAAQIMSHPVISVQTSDSVEKVKDVMSRFEHTGLPVLAGKRLKGIVTLHDLDKTLRHGFHAAKVEDYMTSQVITVDATTGLEDIQQLFIRYPINHLPVVNQQQPIGMITRADLFQAMITGRAKISRAATNGFFQIDKQNVKHLMLEQLPKPLLNLIHTAGIIAENLQVKAFLVGGFVRDLLLKISNWDVDIVVEGDGVNYAQVLSKQLGARVKSHERFRTAVIKLPNKLKIDVTTARTEYYDHPAALPHVEQATIKYDLYRRDFSINTLAVQINHDQFGQLIDYFGGIQDLQDGRLRVLYAVSFVEDPTRMFRAVRFEQRLGFQIEPDTMRYLHQAIAQHLDGRLSLPRIFDEVFLMLAEEEPERGITRLGNLGLLTWLHKKLSSYHVIAENFHMVWESLAFAIIYLEEKVDKRDLYMMALLDELSSEEATQLAQQCQFTKSLKELLQQQKTYGDQARKKIENMQIGRPEQVVNLLWDLSLEVVLYEMSRCDNQQGIKLFRKYLLTWRKIKPILTGRDLKKIGYLPGPLYEKILTKLRNGHLNGKLHTRRDELNCLRRYYPLTGYQKNDES